MACLTWYSYVYRMSTSIWDPYEDALCSLQYDVQKYNIIGCTKWCPHGQTFFPNPGGGFLYYMWVDEPCGRIDYSPWTKTTRTLVSRGSCWDHRGMRRALQNLQNDRKNYNPVISGPKGQTTNYLELLEAGFRPPQNPPINRCNNIGLAVIKLQDNESSTECCVSSDDRFETDVISVDLPLNCCLNSSDCDIGQYCCNGVCENLPCLTPTPTPTPTSTVAPTPTITSTSTPTSTAAPTPTITSTSTPTNTPTKSVTPTQTATPTITPTLTPTPTPVPCIGEVIGAYWDAPHITCNILSEVTPQVNYIVNTVNFLRSKLAQNGYTCINIGSLGPNQNYRAAENTACYGSCDPDGDWCDCLDTDGWMAVNPNAGYYPAPLTGICNRAPGINMCGDNYDQICYGTFPYDPTIEFNARCNGHINTDAEPQSLAPFKNWNDFEDYMIYPCVHG